MFEKEIETMETAMSLVSELEWACERVIALMRAAEPMDEAAERERVHQIVYLECAGQASCEQAAALLLRERAAVRAPLQLQLEAVRADLETSRQLSESRYVELCRHAQAAEDVRAEMTERLRHATDRAERNDDEAKRLRQELAAERRLVATYRKGAEESAARWNAIDNHQALVEAAWDLVRSVEDDDVLAARLAFAERLRKTLEAPAAR